MKKKKTRPPVLLTQKTDKKTVIEILADEGKNFIFSDSLEQEFEMMKRAKEIFQTTSSVSKTLLVLSTEFDITSMNARKVFDRMGEVFPAVNRERYRDLMIDAHFEYIKRAMNVAEESKDAFAMAKCAEINAKAIEQFLGTNSAIDQSKLHLPDVLPGFRHEWFKDVPAIDTPKYLQIINDFRQRKDRKNRLEAQDIDYEEVK
jgi:hypothetical protein